MAHQLSVLYEVVEVSSRVNHSKRVVELCGFIAFLFNIVQEILEVVVRDRELVQQTILLEDLHAEMKKSCVAKGILVLENIEVPFVKVVH